MINTILIALIALTLIGLVIYLDWVSDRISAAYRKKNEQH